MELVLAYPHQLSCYVNSRGNSTGGRESYSEGVPLQVIRQINIRTQQTQTGRVGCFHRTTLCHTEYQGMASPDEVDCSLFSNLITATTVSFQLLTASVIKEHFWEPLGLAERV